MLAVNTGMNHLGSLILINEVSQHRKMDKDHFPDIISQDCPQKMSATNPLLSISLAVAVLKSVL